MRSVPHGLVIEPDPAGRHLPGSGCSGRFVANYGPGREPFPDPRGHRQEPWRWRVMSLIAFAWSLSPTVPLGRFGVGVDLRLALGAGHPVARRCLVDGHSAGLPPPAASACLLGPPAAAGCGIGYWAPASRQAAQMVYARRGFSRTDTVGSRGRPHSVCPAPVRSVRCIRGLSSGKNTHPAAWPSTFVTVPVSAAHHRSCRSVKSTHPLELTSRVRKSVSNRLPDSAGGGGSTYMRTRG